MSVIAEQQAAQLANVLNLAMTQIGAVLSSTNYNPTQKLAREVKDMAEVKVLLASIGLILGAHLDFQLCTAEKSRIVVAN